MLSREREIECFATQSRHSSQNHKAPNAQCYRAGGSRHAGLSGSISRYSSGSGFAGRWRLITAIKCRCGVGKHLGDQLGVAQEQLGLMVAFVAGDKNVGVKEGVCRPTLTFCLKYRRGRDHRAVLFQQRCYVQGDGRMLAPVPTMANTSPFRYSCFSVWVFSHSR